MSQWTLRKTLVVVHIGLAAVGLADAALALRLNEALGIDARVFAGLDQFAYWFGFQCKLLPIYALATRICAGCRGDNDRHGPEPQEPRGNGCLVLRGGADHPRRDRLQ